MFCTVTLTPLLLNLRPDDSEEAVRFAAQGDRLQKMLIPAAGGDGSTSV